MNNILLLTEKREQAAKELLEEIVNCVQCRVGGYWVKITKDENDNDIRIFDLTSLYDKDDGNIFFIKNDATVRSKLDLEVFNKKGKEILRRSFENTDLIIMNEIGFLESKAFEFTSEVKRILDSDKVVLAVIKSLDCTYINSITAREDVSIFKVTEENKAEIKKKVLSILNSYNIALDSCI
jgi:nucleoside-triphosphatase